MLGTMFKVTLNLSMFILLSPVHELIILVYMYIKIAKQFNHNCT